MEQIASPIIFAHRGANQLAPENTLAAFQLAHDLGAHAFEFDVQLSRDSVPVVIHDETLERTTDGMGLVSDYTFAELRKYDAGTWFGNEYAHEKMPSLAEVLQLLIPWKAYLNIELKENALGPMTLVDQVLAVLNQLCYLKEQIFLSSFSEAVMRYLVKKSNGYALAWLVDKPNSETCALATKWKCMSINPNVKILQEPSSTLIEEAKKHSLKIFSYTINDQDIAEMLVAKGLDGFFTDNEMLYSWNHPNKE